MLFDDGTWQYADSFYLYNLKPLSIEGIEIPKIDKIENIINHTGFALHYSKEHKQAVWVAYELTKEKTKKNVERTNKFIADPKVKSRT